MNVQLARDFPSPGLPAALSPSEGERAGVRGRRETSMSERGTAPPAVRPLILGVGNLLLGDEGVGVVAIRQLEAAGFGARCDLVDGGTGGFHLLGLFRDRTHIILIDAAADGQPPGTVSLIQPRFASDFPPSLTAHDIGLKDLIESAALLGDLPRVDLITISVGGVGALTMDLSAPVRAALPRVQALVAERLGAGIPAEA
jgi:hydrogenase maturation protease